MLGCETPWIALAAAGNLGEIKTALDAIEQRIVKQPTTALLVAVLMGWVLGFLAGRYRSQARTHAFQNRGEAILTRALTKRFVAPDYHLLNHVTLRLKEGTTQIDHVLVSRFGIFVVETKDYKGWIFGNSADRFWTQVLFRVRFRFQNPIHQNYKHVCAIQELLEFLPADTIRSVVVFTGNAVFKTDIPDGIFRLNGILDYISGQTTEVLSLNRVQFCVGRLETARLSITKATDVEHIQRLRDRFGSDE